MSTILACSYASPEDPTHTSPISKVEILHWSRSFTSARHILQFNQAMPYALGKVRMVLKDEQLTAI